MRRREFITLFGGTLTAWSLTVRAQQPALPIIGLLDQRSPDELADRLRGHWPTPSISFGRDIRMWL